MICAVVNLGRGNGRTHSSVGDTGEFSLACCHFLTAPLVTVTPYGNLEILVHIPRNRETAVAFCEMEEGVGTAVHQLSSWPEKAW